MITIIPIMYIMQYNIIIVIYTHGYKKKTIDILQICPRSEHHCKIWFWSLRINNLGAINVT